MSQLTAILQKAERQKTMEKALEVLRAYGFVFFTYESLSQILEDQNITEKGELIKPEHSNYSFMLHEEKPMTLDNPGKFHFDLILGIKLNGKKNSNIHVYSDEKYNRTIKMPWKDEQGILWRNVKVRVTFPKEMTYDERRDWRREDRRVKKNPNYEPSQFYLKWKPMVKEVEK